jgi:periplasmic protein TonB
MPHDMFGDVSLRPPSVRSRRSPVVVFSVLVHAAALTALCIVPLLANDTLPTPRRVLDYILPNDVMPIVVAPPAQREPSSVRLTARSENATASADAAPLVSPTGIGPETGLEGMPGSSVPGGPPVDGAIAGLPGAGIEPPPPPPPVRPVRLHEGIRAPQKLVNVAPVYPAIAQAAHAEGTVIMEATIDVHGNVTDVQVLKSHPLLEQAALDAVRQWKFTPTLLNGVPTPIIMTVTVNFKLR